MGRSNPGRHAIRTGVSLLLLLQSVRLTSSLYQQVVGYGLDPRADAATRATAIEASDVSVALTPWIASTWEERGRLMLLEQDSDAAIDAFDNALRSAPADAYLWDDRAAGLIAGKHWGAPLAAAIATANRLAPTAPPIQAWHAELALRHWQWLPPSTRAALAFSLRHVAERDPAGFAVRLMGRPDAAEIRAAMEPPMRGTGGHG